MRNFRKLPTPEFSGTYIPENDAPIAVRLAGGSDFNYATVVKPDC
jgi:hypothetical protein